MVFTVTLSRVARMIFSHGKTSEEADRVARGYLARKNGGGLQPRVPPQEELRQEEVEGCRRQHAQPGRVVPGLRRRRTL